MIQLGSNVDFRFNDVTTPKKAVAKLLLFKKQYEEALKVKIDEDLAGDKKHMEILVEALGEVVREYLEERGESATVAAESNEEAEFEEEA
jgi:hypothetical protein